MLTAQLYVCRVGKHLSSMRVAPRRGVGSGSGVGKSRAGLAAIGRYLRRVWVAYGVLLISLVLTILAWYYVRQNVEAQTRTRFDETTQATQEAIERRTKAYLDAMFGARGLFYASDSVTRKEWGNYVEGIEPERRFEGLQALSYAEYVRPEQREGFVLEASQAGLPGLRPDLDPGGERSAYFPITYTGPLNEANAEMLDYDFYAEDAHREAMDEARDTGTPQATKMVYVLAGAGSGTEADLALRPGFVVYLPVYEKGEPTGTVAERRRTLQGFIVGTFISDELLAGVFKGAFHPLIDFEVYDGPNPTSSPLLYDSDGILRGREQNKENPASGSLFSGRTAQGETGEDALFARESRLEVVGREWSLYFATLPQFEEAAESKLPEFVLASGGAVSTLLFGITWMLVRSRTRAERISTDLAEANKELEAFSSEAQTRYRTLVEQIPAITYVQEPLESSNPKAITYMSPQYETILGYHPELKVLDEEHWLRILHPEDRGRVLAEEARTDESGEPFKMEYRVIAKDGRVVWLRDEATLVRDEEGRPLYWLGVQYDITEQKRVEDTLREVREGERFRMARDLHDGVLQDLSYTTAAMGLIMLNAEDTGLEQELKKVIEAQRRAAEG